MSFSRTNVHSEGEKSPIVCSKDNNTTTLIYGLPSQFTSEILYDGPRRCIVGTSRNNSPEQKCKTSGSSFSAFGGSEDSNLNVVLDVNDGTVERRDVTDSQNPKLKGSFDPISYLPDSELSDVPLNSNDDCKKAFDVSDISKQLVLLSPFSGKKFATLHCENLNGPKTLLSVFTEKANDVIPSVISQVTHPRCTSVAMPSVEDGLSSGSDSLSPNHASRPRIREAPFDIRPFSGSPDSVTDIYCGNCAGNSCSDSPTGGALLNPFLVQDISNEIRDIKRTLSTAEHTREDVQSYGSSISKEKLDKKTGRIIDQHGEINEKSSNSEVSTVEAPSTFSRAWNKINENKGKQIVQAVVECTNEDIPEQVTHDKVDVVSNILGSPASKCDSCSQQQVHQWTFPVQVHTVHSSSEDESHHKNAKSVPIKSHLKSHNCSGREQSVFSPSSSFNSPQRGQYQLSTKPNDSHESSMKSYSRNSDHANNIATNVCKLSQHHSDRRDGDFDSDEDTAQLLNKQYQADKEVYIPELKDKSSIQAECQRRVREVSVRHPEHPDVLIHGLLFRAQYMGSTQIMCNKHSTRMSRMIQAQEVVNRIKAPDEESQPSVTVELFVSTERIMILNANLEDILIDHNLRTVSYIADIGELFVLMSRRPELTPSDISESPSDNDNSNKAVDDVQDVNYASVNGGNINNNNNNTCDSSTPSQRSLTSVDSNISELINSATARSTLDKLKKHTKMICHVLESSDAQLIAQTVGHAFQLAYLDFLKENGVEDVGIIKQLDYDNVLKQQEIFCDELSLFCNKDNHKEVTIPKQKGEALGVVIVESGWGSLLPTALLANMHPTGPAARCGQLNIGNQIVAINGQSLVGLPLLTCQQIIKNCRSCTTVKLMVINCPPVVEVLIRRPSLNFQLGFSVQDGVICSLLRGGIAERGGIRVDHRIIEINGESVVAVSHERIVQLLATSVGEIHIRTMPTSVFRLLTGQIIPRYI
uniref:PDZ domain-containing protein n=1 Tax=Trichobilharzia regenti TaxID=157069 RepID=A0AA85ISH5_TRIRE|nr:unnamed protein product [Trichobilharzia regenti]